MHNMLCIQLITVSFQEQEFVAKQAEDLDLAMKNITAQNRKEISDKERKCLNKKQHLMRGERLDPNEGEVGKANMEGPISIGKQQFPLRELYR